MDLYEWLLFLHVLSAFVAVAGITAIWGLIAATRGGATETIDGPTAERFGALVGPVIGASMGLALVFGVWMVLDLDGYGIFDGWILGSLVLWAFASWAGERAGRVFATGPDGRGKAINLHAASTLAVAVILVLMIWKPGA